MTVRLHLSTEWQRLVRDLRIEAGLSQRALAAKTGLNRSSLRRFEAGLTTGDLPTLETILTALGFELDVLVKTAPKPKDQRNGEAQSVRSAVH